MFRSQYPINSSQIGEECKSIIMDIELLTIFMEVKLRSDWSRLGDANTDLPSANAWV